MEKAHIAPLRIRVSRIMPWRTVAFTVMRMATLRIRTKVQRCELNILLLA